LSKPIAREVADKLGAPDNFAPAADSCAGFIICLKSFITASLKNYEIQSLIGLQNCL